MHAVAVTVLMDLPPDHLYHRATLAALAHASTAAGIPIEVRVAPTDTIRDAALIATSGCAVVIGPGSPYRNPDAALEVVRLAREQNVPLVGT